MLTPAQIAEVCHEANRAYCRALGDFSQPSWDEAPMWQQSSAISGVVAKLENPGLTPEQSHEEWLAHKAAEGWTYGPVKNPELKQHPCFVPYSELPADQQIKDALFVGIVRALS